MNSRSNPTADATRGAGDGAQDAGSSTNRATQAEEEPRFFLRPHNLYLLVAYNIAVVIGSSAMLIVVLLKDKNIKPLAATLMSVLVAGTLGGSLCNLRGVFTNLQRNRGYFPARLQIPFYVRPVTGAATGLCTFFVGSLLVTSLAVDSASGSWETLPGRLPYIALALLAGFASQEFMQRLKEVAKTLFSERATKDDDSALERLAALHKEGVLDEAEFKNEKAKLLGVNNERVAS
jgi:Short C-terminal domain